MKKINYYCIMIFILVFLDLSCFMLLPISITQDYLLILTLLFCAFIFFKTISMKTIDMDYIMILIIPLIIVLISSYMSKISFNQPISLGIRAQRHWIRSLLLYFSIKRMFKAKLINAKNMIFIIDLINIICFIFVLIQAIVGQSYQFLNVIINNRNGLIRIYAPCAYMIISFSYHLTNIINGEKNSKDILYVLISIIYIFLFVQTRMRIFAIIISILLYSILFKLNKRKILFSIVFIILILIFSITPLGKDILYMIFDPSKSEQNSANIRELGRTFFMDETFSSFRTALFGVGFPNITWPNTVANVGSEKGYFLNDNGIFGIMYMYGISFVIWMFFVYKKIISNSYKNNQMFIILVCFINLFGMISLFPDCYNNYFSFSIIYALSYVDNKYVKN